MEYSLNRTCFIILPDATVVMCTLTDDEGRMMCDSSQFEDFYQSITSWNEPNR